MRKHYKLFFTFPILKELTNNNLPLACINGGLILDSGEAERTFIFRCQDRYLIYNSIAGFRSLLFVSDNAHMDIYENQIDILRSCLIFIASYIQIDLETTIPKPFYVICNLDTLKLSLSESFLEQLKAVNVLDNVAKGGVYLNQVSPTYADMLHQFVYLLKKREIEANFDHEKCRVTGQLALHFHNKVSYVQLLQKRDFSHIPLHTKTAIIDPISFLNVKNWQDLQSLYARSHTTKILSLPKAFFVKSSQDSSGNVSAILDQEDFQVKINKFHQEIKEFILSTEIDYEARLKDLRNEINENPVLSKVTFPDHKLLQYLELQIQCRKDINLLLQEKVVSSSQNRSLPEGIGVSYYIDDQSNITFIVLAAQVYADQEKKHYLGSFFSERLSELILTPDMHNRMLDLCRFFADEGYQGPINFDARLNSQGVYEFIYDCNPRLTAVYPLLAVKSILEQNELRIQSILNLGYRGEFIYPNISAKLNELDRESLLYTRIRQKGIFLLPNLYRKDGYDVFMLNMELLEINHILESQVLTNMTGIHSIPASRIFF